MLAMPVPCDVQSRRKPRPLARGGVIEKTCERGCASRAPDQPAVQSDGHHFRRLLAFGIERVECVLEIGKEVIAGAETLCVDETHVVGVERVGNDEMWSFRSAHPIWQIVGVGIRGIKKAAVVEYGLQGAD